MGDRSSDRSDARGEGCKDHFYVAPARVEAEELDDVTTSMVLLCQQSTSTLFDLCSTFSYVSIYFASRLGVFLEPLAASLHVLTE